MKEEKYRRALKPDAQAFDEIRFITVPRYKTSGMSGDEWRISIKMEFWRKGKLIHTEDFAGHNLEKAMAFASSNYARACDNGMGLYAGEYNCCDQEGCSKQATVTYKLLKEWCDRCGKDKPAQGYLGQKGVIRKFCTEHKIRGDCALEDADSNYEEISDPDNV